MGLSALFPGLAQARRLVTKGSAAAFSPTDVSGLKLWLKADAGAYSDSGTTLCANNDTVKQWNDQSGNSNNVTQVTSGKRPTYKTGIQNGQPVLRFDGVDDFLQMGANPAMNGELTVFVVVNANAPSSTVVILN